MNARKKTTKYTMASIIISLVAIALVAFHLCVKQLDAVALALIGIAFLPWVIPILKSVELPGSLKSVELPGGLKFEFRDLLEKAKEDLEQTPLLADESSEQGLIQQAPQSQDILESIAEQDPNIALAGLRIEIERKLSALAQSGEVPVRRQNIRQLMDALYRAGYISQTEYSALADIIHLLNRAAHGAEISRSDAEWALSFGARLLKGLDARTSEQSAVVEVKSLVERFHGQIVPGRIFNLEGEFQLPNFLDVEVEASLDRFTPGRVDILASSNNEKWVIEVKRSLRGSSSFISLLERLPRYKELPHVIVWLVLFVNVTSDFRRKASEQNILLTGFSELDELRRILDAPP